MILVFFFRFHPSGNMFATNTSLFDMRNLQMPVRTFQIDAAGFTSSGISQVENQVEIYRFAHVPTCQTQFVYS